MSLLLCVIGHGRLSSTYVFSSLILAETCKLCTHLCIPPNLKDRLLGLPGSKKHVLTYLESQSFPIASASESWSCDNESDCRLRLRSNASTCCNAVAIVLGTFHTLRSGHLSSRVLVDETSILFARIFLSSSNRQACRNNSISFHSTAKVYAEHVNTRFASPSGLVIGSVPLSQQRRSQAATQYPRCTITTKTPCAVTETSTFLTIL